MLRQLSLRAGLFTCTSVAFSACFAPTISDGLACSETDRCPGNQVCTAGTCIFPGQNNMGPDGSVGDGNSGPCVGSEFFAPTTPAAIQNFSVPACATNLTIEAFGAQGGGTSSDGNAGGKGARILGNFAITNGVAIQVLVGEAGRDGSPAGGFEQGGGTGGGGSFVIDNTGLPMIIAAGGGGATEGPSVVQRGGPGQITLNAQDGGGHADSGGIDDSGGLEGGLSYTYSNAGFHGGTGGGSFVSPGEDSSNGDLKLYGSANGPGESFMNGGAGGQGGSLGRDGGFGGGGASGFTGGGGGGYTGGGASGPGLDSTLIGGGGGGSINNGTSPDNSEGENAGPGKVIVTWRK